MLLPLIIRHVVDTSQGPHDMATAERGEAQYPPPPCTFFSLSPEAGLRGKEQDILPPSLPARLLAEDEWGNY